MMKNFLALFQKGKRPDTEAKDEVAKLLQTNPEALSQFESAYKQLALDVEQEGTFSTNSRQAAEKAHTIPGEAGQNPYTEDEMSTAEDMTEQIVQELLAQTTVYSFDGDLTQKVIPPRPALPDGAKEITNEAIKALPIPLRPQLTGSLLCKDLDVPAYLTLMSYYKQAMDSKLSQKKRGNAYGLFRQGLDIMDLDPVMYEMLDSNKNSMGYWLPKLVSACTGQSFFKIPATKVVKVPLPLLQLTRLEYTSLTPVTLSIVDKWAMKAFDLDVRKDYFIKTGTYSSKFDFRNVKVTSEKEVRELGEYLLYIHYQANQMAGPLVMPRPIVGTSTTNEWVVRDFIPDTENNPTIYKGLPLHTEYRVFVDCETKRVIGFTPYWDPEGMKNRFGHQSDADNPHNTHDYMIFKAHEDTLMDRYYANIDLVLQEVEKLLPGLDLPGQWSLDIMQNGEDFWLIDMGLAEQSTFREVIPKALRRPMKEEWLPNLGEITPPWDNMPSLMERTDGTESKARGDAMHINKIESDKDKKSGEQAT